MSVEEELAGLSPKKDTMLTIGVFDGVHLGHKYLLSQLKELAGKQGLLSGVVTFRQHPQVVLYPQTELPLLTDPAEKAKLLENEGIEVIVTLSFTRELAQLSARRFLSLLKKHLRMRGMVIGPDFVLGRDREGNVDALRVLGKDMNFSVSVIPPVMINGEVVSSTAVRKAITDGDVKKVRNLVGRFFSLQGRVVSGEGRGRELDFPTANLDLDSKKALPADGIYATRVYIDDKKYQSMTNVGVRPTFSEGKRAVEVYVLDYQGNLYGREIKVDFIQRLRSERRFDTIEELKKQIAEDVKEGRAILAELEAKQ